MLMYFFFRAPKVHGEVTTLPLFHDKMRQPFSQQGQTWMNADTVPIFVIEFTG